MAPHIAEACLATSQACSGRRTYAGTMTGPSDALFTHIDHVGIAVPDLDAAIAFYESAYGMALLHEETNEEQGVREAMMAVGESGSCIQLLAPLSPESTIAKFLDRSGPGMQQIAYRVTDIDAVCATLRERGLRLLYDDPQARHERQPRQLHPPQGRRRRPRRARGAVGQLGALRRRPCTSSPAPAAPSQRYAGHSARRSRPPTQDLRLQDEPEGERGREGDGSHGVASCRRPTTALRLGSAAARRRWRARPGAAARRPAPPRARAARVLVDRGESDCGRAQPGDDPQRRGSRPGPARCQPRVQQDGPDHAEQPEEDEGGVRAARWSGEHTATVELECPGPQASWPSELIVSSRRL